MTRSRTVLFVALLGFLAAGSAYWLSPRPKTKLEALQEFKDHKEEFPLEAAEYWEIFRETPNKENPAKLLYEAKLAVENNRSLDGSTGPLNLNFNDIGPGNPAGRIRAMVVHPANPDLMLIGGVSGGVWKSLDGGLTWTPKTDFLDNLSINSMALDPDNPNTVFAGTGEGFFNIDALSGLGIFRSNDFGETWNQVASTNSNNFLFVNRLALIPGTDIMIAATRAGLFRTTTLGTVNDWTSVGSLGASSRGWVDLRLDPSNTARLYAFHYGSAITTRIVARSTDSGASFTSLGAAEGVPTTDIGRMEIGVGSDGVVYLSVGNLADTTRGLWRSPAGGNNFVKTASNANYIIRQAWYDLPIGVDPSDSNRVFIGAVDLWRTTDGGATISRISTNSPGAGQISDYIHSDLHDVVFHPSTPQTFWVLSDGGIFKTTDGGDNFITLNNNLRITQFYGIAVHPDGTQAIAGTQDNGTFLFFGDRPVWLRWAGGDGGRCAWDQQQPQFVYGETPNAGLFGSNDGGFSTTTMSSLFGRTGALWASPMAVDPNDGNRFIIGTNSIFYSENVRQLGGASFIDANGGPFGGGSVSATTFSPHNGQIAFAGMTNGNIFRTANLALPGPATFASINTGLPGSAVSWIEVDPHDPTSDTIYATFGGFLTNRVWKTTNGGASWSSLHGDLPNIPVHCIAVDPLDPDRLYIGTELGVFTTDNNTDGVVNWAHYDYGPAWTRVSNLTFSDDGALWVGTHGRGMFHGTKDAIEVATGTPITVDCGDEDGYIDLGETVDLPISITNLGGVLLSGVSVSISDNYAGLQFPITNKSYGTVDAGATVTQNFEASLTSLANCLDVANLTVTVTHSQGSSVKVLELTLGADANISTGTFSDGAESAASLFTHEAQLNVDDWARVTTQTHSGSRSWFASDTNEYSDKFLISPWLQAETGNNTLSFWLFYNLEQDAQQAWDGAVLEMRTADSDWFDIGQFSSLAYDAQLHLASALSLRMTWTGDHRTWRQGSVNLGTQYNGQAVQFRFRVSCDTNSLAAGGNSGFWVDDISMTNVSWLASVDCHSATCELPCFASIQEALDAIYLSLGTGEWPAIRSVRDYIGMMNDICE